MTESVKYDFHDQGVTRLVFDQKSICLGLERLDDATETYIPSLVDFSNVSDLTVDGVPSLVLLPVYDDGEVVHFGVADKKATLTIQWNDFKNKKNATKSYEFKFQRMEIK